MNVGRVAQQKRMPGSKVVGDPVMYAIGREPVHLFDLHVQVFDGPAADVFKAQGFSLVCALVAHCADQPGATCTGEGEHGEEVRFIKVHMQFAIEGRPAGLYVGDIENLLVGSARETSVQRLAHH
ncbi:hypothetical protein D3C85_1162460 [compost metagenome]